MPEFDFCRSYLEAGEHILWQGKPERGFVLTPGEKQELLFGLLWCGIGVLITVVAVSKSMHSYLLYSAAIFAVGLIWLVGRPLWRLFGRRHTAYVITNKKILRRQGKKVDVLEGKSMPTAHWFIHKNGNGTVQFGKQSFKGYDTFGRRRTYINRNLFTLYNLADVERVKQALDAL